MASWTLCVKLYAQATGAARESPPLQRQQRRQRRQRQWSLPSRRKILRLASPTSCAGPRCVETPGWWRRFRRRPVETTMVALLLSLPLVVFPLLTDGGMAARTATPSRPASLIREDHRTR
ncbi:unnamed protein product [Scytosiphon promiscuus]